MSPEDKLQRDGRAGRDGGDAECWEFYRKRDLASIKDEIVKQNVLNMFSSACPAMFLRKYFDENSNSEGVMEPPQELCKSSRCMCSAPGFPRQAIVKVPDPFPCATEEGEKFWKSFFAPTTKTSRVVVNIRERASKALEASLKKLRRIRREIFGRIVGCKMMEENSIPNQDLDGIAQYFVEDDFVLQQFVPDGGLRLCLVYLIEKEDEIRKIIPGLFSFCASCSAFSKEAMRWKDDFIDAILNQEKQLQDVCNTASREAAEAAKGKEKKNRERQKRRREQDI